MSNMKRHARDGFSVHFPVYAAAGGEGAAAAAKSAALTRDPAASTSALHAAEEEAERLRWDYNKMDDVKACLFRLKSTLESLPDALVSHWVCGRECRFLPSLPHTQ
jgi:hypothetical protein